MAGTPCASFVRVRPFNEKESTICPDGYSVPREIITWDGKDVLTVLDPQDDFAPRRNGTFHGMNVLWSFKDEESPFQPCTQAEVYKRVVAPAMPAILEGYNVAFIVAGAASSGRLFTLYGDSVEGPNRGILPRFAENIFDAFERQSREDSVLSARMECIDIVGESYVDLLAIRRNRSNNSNNNNSTQFAGGVEELKVVQGSDGARLSGATEAEIKGPVDLQHLLRQVYRTASRRNNTHIVSLHFTETFRFDDPENFGQPVNKSRHVHVLFALFRNMPPAFQRCINVAVEHDSGENPLAKVPVRETAFTRLFPFVFQQGYHLHVISCVSPYYEHAREDLNALLFAVKVKSLVGRPKLRQDERLLEMRLLADEVKGLKVTVRQQNEAMQLVQQELNAREVELMRREAVHNEVSRALNQQQTKLQLAAIARNFENARFKLANEKARQRFRQNVKTLETSQGGKINGFDSIDGLMQAIDDARIRTEALELRLHKKQEVINSQEAQIEKYKADEEELEYLKKITEAPPSEQARLLIAHSAAHKAALQEIQRLEQEKQAIMDGDDSNERMRPFQKDYDFIYAAEKPSRDKEELLKQIEELEKATAQANEEIMRLQGEIENSGGKCHCTLM